MTTKFALALVTALGLTACALGPKKRFSAEHPEKLKKIKTVAVIGFDVTQESTGGMLFDTNLAQKAAGAYSKDGRLQHDAYADEILERAIKALASQTGWRVVPVATVIGNPVYKSIHDRRMNNWLFGGKNDGGGDGDIKFGRRGLLLSNQTIGMGMGLDKDRRAIIEALGVDAVASLHVDFRLPYDGFKVGSLVGSGSGSHKPETSVHMYLRDRQDQALGTLSSEIKTKEAAKAGPELKTLLVKQFEQTLGEGLTDMKEMIR